MLILLLPGWHARRLNAGSIAFRVREGATSVEHALALLARFGPESRVLAGGHSLIPMMKLRLAQPETLIDINGLSGAGLHHGRPTVSCASAR